jgi:hypothetical protein
MVNSNSNVHSNVYTPDGLLLGFRGIITAGGIRIQKGEVSMSH